MKQTRAFPRGGPCWIPVITLVAISLTSCAPEREPELDFLIATETAEYDGVSVTPQRITELRRDIREHRDRVQELTTAMGRVASLEKLLANELMQQGMFQPALEALQRAMELQTENAVLFYLAAVASARSAGAHIVDGNREDYLRQAEELYRQALRINPDYREVQYGLAVLLTFELERPEDALPHARRAAALETRDPAIRFLLANVLVRTERFREAAEIYDDLARSAPSAEQRRRAAENRDAVRSEMQ